MYAPRLPSPSSPCRRIIVMSRLAQSSNQCCAKVLRVATFRTRVQYRIYVAPKICSRHHGPAPRTAPRARKIFELQMNRATPSMGDQRPLPLNVALNLTEQRCRPTFAPSPPPAQSRALSRPCHLNGTPLRIRSKFAHFASTLAFISRCYVTCVLQRRILSSICSVLPIARPFPSDLIMYVTRGNVCFFIPHRADLLCHFLRVNTY